MPVDAVKLEAPVRPAAAQAMSSVVNLPTYGIKRLTCLLKIPADVCKAQYRCVNAAYQSRGLHLWTP